MKKLQKQLIIIKIKLNILFNNKYKIVLKIQIKKNYSLTIVKKKNNVS